MVVPVVARQSQDWGALVDGVWSFSFRLGLFVFLERLHSNVRGTPFKQGHILFDLWL